MVAKKSVKKKILVLMNAVSSGDANSLSGGDRILIELFKRWRRHFEKVDILTCSVGEKVVKRYIRFLKNISFKIIKVEKKYYQNLFLLYLYKTIKGLEIVNQIKKQDYDYVYSSSDFWPDSIPAFWLKIKNPKIIWLAGFYLFAPSPFQEDSPYKDENFLKGFLFWLTQLPIYFIVKNWADYVFVTSEPDVEKFITTKRKRKKIIVVQGGVDITKAKKYLRSQEVMPVEKRKYDACFVGRFHYQKGVLELIDIWKKVCRQKKKAKLAMIGIGPLEGKVREKIRKYKLERNIDLLGFRDGEDKYRIFRQSKMILHPATYDSGGMAAAEGMAWGLPGVSFDLESLKTYYPQGMVKTSMVDLDKFAENILKLLEDKGYHQKISQNAIDLIQEVWDWDKRAKRIYQQVFGSFG